MGQNRGTNGTSLQEVGVSGRLHDCVVRVLESNLQNFRRHQAHGPLRKPHDTVGVHQHLNGPWGHTPAFQHLEEAEMVSIPRVTPYHRVQSVHTRYLQKDILTS